MKHPKFFLFSLLCGLLLISTTSAAAPQQSKQSKPGPANRICQRLDCSDSQREEVGASLKQLRQQQRGAKERMRALSEKVSAELKRARPDESVISDTYAEVDRLHLALRDAVHESVMSIHETLNARQRERAAPMLTRILLSRPEHKRPRGRDQHGMRSPEGDRQQRGGRRGQPDGR